MSPAQGAACQANGRTGLTLDSSRDVRLELLQGFQAMFKGYELDLPQSAQRVLAFLGLQTRPLSRSFVAAKLWMDCSEERAAANLRSALWRANRPECRLVDADSRLIRLARDVSVDVRESTKLAHAVLDGDVDCTDIRLEGLVGDILPGWYEEWVVFERERFHQLRVHALESLCDQLAASRRYVRAEQAGLAAISGEPLRESSHRALIRVYLGGGNRGEAIRQYGVCRGLLRDELGIDPSPDTESLVEAFLAGGGGERALGTEELPPGPTHLG
jgi:DNA-binding SARP family transcriptional activator